MPFFKVFPFKRLRQGSMEYFGVLLLRFPDGRSLGTIFSFQSLFAARREADLSQSLQRAQRLPCLFSALHLPDDA
jgi:hypothetical protein